MKAGRFISAGPPCPCCGSSFHLMLQSSPELVRCLRCGMNRLKADEIKIEKRYSDSYFLDEYKDQYGRTYLEDQSNIESLARQRLRVINHTVSTKNRSLLDIGCAYGFFLSEARKSGWDTEGTDIIEQPLIYAQMELGLKVTRSRAENMEFSSKYGAITLWYVLEHLKDPCGFLKRTAAALEQGGVLALGLPNGSGITYRVNPEYWLQSRPNDHFSDFTYKALRLMGKKIGLRISAVVSRGIHYDRYRKAAHGIFRLIPRYVFELYCRLFHAGDTFEIYFIKE